MQKCLKENKLCLISLIVIGIGIVLMIWLRQELLGNLVKYLAIPLTIIVCVYLLKDRVFDYLDTRDIEGELKGVPFAIRKAIEEDKQSVFDETGELNRNHLVEIAAHHYLGLVIDKQSTDILSYKLLEECIQYLEKNNYEPKRLELLKYLKELVIENIALRNIKKKRVSIADAVRAAYPPPRKE